MKFPYKRKKRENDWVDYELSELRELFSYLEKIGVNQI